MIKPIAAGILVYVIAGTLALPAQNSVARSQSEHARNTDSARADAPGRISGRVLSHGAAQPGVAVAILQQDGRLLRTVYTEPNGWYHVDQVAPGRYAAAVMLPNFVPFWNSAVSVASGAEVLLDINLQALAESVQVALPPSPRESVSDWKWVLRSSAAARPVLRFLPVVTTTYPSDPRNAHEAALSGTLQVLAGNETSGFGQDPGLRTDFDMAYGAQGSQWFGLSGSAGLARGTPAASIRASWNRRTDDGDSTTLSFTARQLFLANQYWAGNSALLGSSDNTALSGTVAYQESRRLTDSVAVQYGSLFDALNFAGRPTRWSPYAKVSYAPMERGRLTVAYNAASPRVLPYDWDPEHSASEQWLAVPQMSTGPDGKPVLENGRHAEVRWEQAVGLRFRYESAVFYDDISQTALSLALNPSSSLAGALLQDPFSDRYFMGADKLAALGGRAAIGVKVSADTELIAGYDYAGALQSDSPVLFAAAPDALRGLLRMHRAHSFVVKVSSRMPYSHTQIIPSYRWVPNDVAAVPDPYDRGWSQAAPYLNLYIAQPIHSPDIFQGQFQAVAEFTNLLAQGYVPVVSPDGSVGYLFAAARAFRGGLSFVF